MEQVKANESTPAIQQLHQIHYPIEGQPKQYIFTANNGGLYFMDEEASWDELKEATYLGHRLLNGVMFKDEKVKQWAELFFINSQGVVSVITFHSGSRFVFERLLQKMLYFTSIPKITISREEVKGFTAKDGKKYNFWKLSFAAKETGIPISELQKLKAYRASTQTGLHNKNVTVTESINVYEMTEEEIKNWNEANRFTV